MKNLANELFKVSRPPRTPVCGGLLVAEPFLSETYFNHGVVSVIDYIPEEGATGVVMNNRTEYFLSDLLEGISPEADMPVFCGGPLGLDRLYFLHNLGPEVIPGARKYAEGLYVGGHFDAVIDYINQGYEAEGSLRFFIGYSSWTAMQLERELQEGTWAQIAPNGDNESIFRDFADKCWHRAVRALGESYRSWQLIPRNPEYN